MTEIAHCDCNEPCEAKAPTRNNYFTGKLLVERDFTDEQHYFREKIRLHHQRLHGVGVVCGLAVVQHPNEACRDRLVILQPGSAVDCCGNDVYVIEPETIDLTAFPAVKALIDESKVPGAPNPPAAHTLQLCLKYRECPSETVPVLFDECGCDDTQCAPNRILESFDLDVRIDPPAPVVHHGAGALATMTTLNIPHARLVAFDAANDRLYVADDSTLNQLSLSTHAKIATAGLALRPIGLAVLKDGSVAVALHDPDTAADTQLAIFAPNGGTIAAAPDRKSAIAGTGTGAGRRSFPLVALADGRLLGLSKSAFLWPEGVPDPGAPSESNTALVGGVPFGFGANDAAFYLSKPNPPGRIHAIDPNAPGLPETEIGGANPDSELFSGAVAVSTGPDRVLLLDRDTRTAMLFDTDSKTLLGTAQFTDEPVAAAVGPGGNWALVVTDDGATHHVQTLSLAGVASGAPTAPGPAVDVGDRRAHSILISPDGKQAYVPRPGDPDDPAAGDVIVLGISETDCVAVLRGGDCPGCIEPDCVVLATIENWRPGFKFTDMPGQPADLAGGIARLDNVRGRVWLPSTQAIANALLCLIEKGGGGGGTQGPVGPEGPKGEDGKNGVDGVDGATGADGKDALDPDLTHICRINWAHRGEMPPEQLRKGLVVAFDRMIERRDIDALSFQVQVETRDENGLVCFCDWPAELLRGVIIDPPCTEADPKWVPAAKLVNGIRWLPKGYPALLGRDGGRIRVLIHCDLMADEKGKSVDGNHLAPWLGNPGTVSGDGIAGGMFESSFFVPPDPQSAVADNNAAAQPKPAEAAPAAAAQTKIADAPKAFRTAPKVKQVPAANKATKSRSRKET